MHRPNWPTPAWWAISSRASNGYGCRGPVPPFFCVVIESPWTAIADVVPPFPGVDAGVERLTTWAETARSAAERVPLTPETQTAILKKGVGLGLRDVAVRACVVGRDGQLGEDDAADPFAGLTDSYLYVGAGALIDRISACAASVFSVKSVLYRARRGIDPQLPRHVRGHSTNDRWSTLIRRIHA